MSLIRVSEPPPPPPRPSFLGIGSLPGLNFSQELSLDYGETQGKLLGEDESLGIKRTFRDLPCKIHSCQMAQELLLACLFDGELSSLKVTSCIINQILLSEGASSVKWKSAPLECSRLDHSDPWGTRE